MFFLPMPVSTEQAGIRPVIIFQNDLVSQFSTTDFASINSGIEISWNLV